VIDTRNSLVHLFVPSLVGGWPLNVVHQFTPLPYGARLGTIALASIVCTTSPR
jgi:hypothetical protein